MTRPTIVHLHFPPRRRIINDRPDPDRDPHDAAGPGARTAPTTASETARPPERDVSRKEHHPADKVGRASIEQGAVSGEGVTLEDARATARVLCQRKWSTAVVWHLAHGAHRFTQLQRALPRVTHKVLVTTLRSLERDGVVTRRAR